MGPVFHCFGVAETSVEAFGVGGLGCAEEKSRGFDFFLWMGGLHLGGVWNFEMEFVVRVA